MSIAAKCVCFQSPSGICTGTGDRCPYKEPKEIIDEWANISKSFPTQETEYIDKKAAEKAISQLQQLLSEKEKEVETFKDAMVERNDRCNKLQQSNEAKDKEIADLEYEESLQTQIIEKLQKEIEYWKQLAGVQKEYIRFLDNESSKYVQFAGIHGMKVPDEVFEKGQERRNKISHLEVQLQFSQSKPQ